jgi:hypothetical protein
VEAIQRHKCMQDKRATTFVVLLPIERDSWGPHVLCPKMEMSVNTSLPLTTFGHCNAEKAHAQRLRRSVHDYNITTSVDRHNITTSVDQNIITVSVTNKTTDQKLHQYAEKWRAFSAQLAAMTKTQKAMKAAMWGDKRNKIISKFKGCVHHRLWKGSSFHSEMVTVSNTSLKAKFPGGRQSDFPWYGSAAASWVQIDLEARHIVTGFTFHGTNVKDAAGAPVLKSNEKPEVWSTTDLTLAYSDDGWNWTPLQSKPGQVIPRTQHICIYRYNIHTRVPRCVGQFLCVLNIHIHIICIYIYREKLEDERFCFCFRTRRTTLHWLHTYIL